MLVILVFMFRNPEINAYNMIMHTSSVLSAVGVGWLGGHLCTFTKQNTIYKYESVCVCVFLHVCMLVCMRTCVRTFVRAVCAQVCGR